MERLTFQQRTEILNIHYKYGENFAVTLRKTRALLGRAEAPSRPEIVKLVKKLEPLGQLSDVKNPNHKDLEPRMADTDAKRKGRPKKRESEAVEAPAKSPPKKVAVSNGDDAAVPAKRGRGRPPKGSTKASKKPPPVPGRGRGRPPSKPAAAPNKKKETSDEEEEDEEEEDEKKESSGEADSS